MRNQFGGHAVQADGPADHRRRRLAGRQVAEVVEPLVRRPPVAARLPLLRRPRGRAGAGCHVVRRPQRAGQDQHRRGDRLPLPAVARTASPPTCRWCGAAPSQAVVRAAVVRDERRAVLEIEINPGKSNRARVNRSQLPRARELLGLVRTVVFAPDDLALVKGDPTERRRFADDLLVLHRGGEVRRHPQRLRPGAQAAQLPAEDRAWPGQLGRVGALHPGGVGRAPGPPRRGDHGLARPAGGGAEPAAGQGLRGGRPRGDPRRRVAHLQAELLLGG